MLAQVWSDLPLVILLILGGLMTVDADLLDAADVDGASRLEAGLADLDPV